MLLLRDMMVLGYGKLNALGEPIMRITPFLIPLCLVSLPLTSRAEPTNKPLPVPWFRPLENTDDLKEMANDNPDRKIVEARVERLKASYKNISGYELPHVAPPLQLETATLSRLFPQHRFYLIRFNQVAAKKNGQDGISVAHGLYFVMVVRPQGEPIELGGYGNYEEFGTLLKANKVQIKTQEDADLIWKAFNDAHQKKWLDKVQNRQVTPNQWALGENVIDGTRYWYDVKLDENQIVTSAKLNSQKVEAK